VKDLQPGEKRKVEVTLDKYAVSHWSEVLDTWVVQKASYGVTVSTQGVSNALSLEKALTGEVKIEKGFEWRGL
jgi:beta-glucosidase